jgi:uncharacterized protein (UPF0261 family)
MPGRVAVLGTFDTKGAELLHIAQCLHKLDLDVALIDISCLEHAARFKPDYSPVDVAAAAGADFKALSRLPRVEAAPLMSAGAARILHKLASDGSIQACLGIGGANGTSMGVAAMESLPLGFPKAIVSVMAAVDARWLVSHTDIVLFNAIGDAVLNPLLEAIIERAARAINGMAAKPEPITLPKMVGLSVLGVTDQCIEYCRELLTAKRYPSLLLHSNGPGGATLEKMVDQGYFWAVLDITTNELLNHILGGVFDAGPHRLDAAIGKELPLVVSTGAIDFVNFWGNRIPDEYRQQRMFMRHSTVNTLMRTSAKENERLAAAMAAKLNRARVPVRVVIPARGFSKYDRDGGATGADLDGNPVGPWHSPAANSAFIAALQGSLQNPLVAVEVVDRHINDPQFARALIDALEAVSGTRQ